MGFWHSPLERIYGCLANSEKPAAEWETEFKQSHFAPRAFPLSGAPLFAKTTDESSGRLSVPRCAHSRCSSRASGAS